MKFYLAAFFFFLQKRRLVFVFTDVKGFHMKISWKQHFFWGILSIGVCVIVSKYFTKFDSVIHFSVYNVQEQLLARTPVSNKIGK